MFLTTVLQQIAATGWRKGGFSNALQRQFGLVVEQKVLCGLDDCSGHALWRVRCPLLPQCHMLMSSLQSRSCEAPASPEGSLAASPAELSLQRQLKCTQKPPLAILHVDQSLELQCPGQEINEISPARKDYKNVNFGFVKRAHLFWSTICFFAPQVETAYLRHAEVVCDYSKETTRKIPQVRIQGRLQVGDTSLFSSTTRLSSLP